MKPPKRKRVPTRFIPDCSDCVREQRKRVSETFETWVCAAEEVTHPKARIIPLGAYTDKFSPGDRVRIKVTKLERGK